MFFRDSNGDPVCLFDRCCHRGAALSYGKVIGDHVQCPFHGLEYDSTGKCVLIPANGKDEPVPERYRVNAYPAKEKHGFIWVWYGEPRKEYPEINFPDDLDELRDQIQKQASNHISHHPTSLSMINVAAGILEKDGKVLIAQRHRNDTHGLKWEFPGGTLRRDEPGEYGIVRELKEELNLDVEVIRYFGCYTEPPLRIQYYLVRMISGEIKLTEHEQVAWVEKDRLHDYDLLSGDRIFVDRLRSI